MQKFVCGLAAVLVLLAASAVRADEKVPLNKAAKDVTEAVKAKFLKTELIADKDEKKDKNQKDDGQQNQFQRKQTR